MPTFWPSIPDDVQAWIKKQPLFFTASAPTYGKHVNLSPKGQPSRTFAIMGPNQVAYLDFTGSGIETISHIYENGRVTLMFCSFTKFCRILRLFCNARVIERDSPDFKPYIAQMAEIGGMRIEEPHPRSAGLDDDADVNWDKATEGNGVLGVRAIVVLDVWKVMHSCGFSVPLLVNGTGADGEGDDGDVEATGRGGKVEEEKVRSPQIMVGNNTKRSTNPNDLHSVKFDETWDDRNVLNEYCVNKLKKNDIRPYRVKNNVYSLDGVPGLEMAIKDSGRNVRSMRIDHFFKRVFFGETTAVGVGVLLGLFLALVFQRIAARVF